MVLDNEEQRKLLLQITNSTGINGNYAQAKQTIILLDKLVADITNAEIKVIAD